MKSQGNADANAAAMIAWSRMGPAASSAAADVFAVFQATDDLRVRVIALDTLGAILEDFESASARQIAAGLGAALKDPRYRRMRKRICRTLSRIGMAARVAITPLGELYRGRGRRNSVRQAARGALLDIGCMCWGQDSAELRREGFRVLTPFSLSYREWILEGIVENDDFGPEVRTEAATRLAQVRAGMESGRWPHDDPR